MEEQLFSFEKYQGVLLQITKIEDHKFADQHPNQINVGYKARGFLNLELSNKHQCVFINESTDRFFHTSQVKSIQECEGYDLVKTVNSLYKVEPQITAIPGVQQKHSVSLE
jgi:hypothetical protein